MFDLYGLDPLNSGSSGAAALGSYKTSDVFADVLADGYFNEAAVNLKSTQALLVKASDKVGIVLISVAGGIVTATEFGGGSDTVSWDDIENKPATFAPIIGSTADTAMAGNTVIPPAATWDNLSGKPSTFPPTIGTTADTALAGNTTIPTQYTDALAQAAIKSKPEIAALTSDSTIEDVIAALKA